MSIYSDANADAVSIDGFVNDDGLIPTRRNGPKPSWQYKLNEWDAEFAAKLAVLDQSRGFRVVGSFASGFTYSLPNDVGVDGSGDYWIYSNIDNLPVVIAPGTVPSGPVFTQVTFNSIDGVIGLRDELDDRAVRLTIAEAVASSITAGQYVVLTDRGNSLWLVSASGSPNGFDVIDLGGSLYLIYQPVDGLVSPIHIGCVGDAATDDTAAMQHMAINHSGNVDFAGLTYLITDTAKFTGKCSIKNGSIKYEPGAGNENNPAIWLQGDNSEIDFFEVDGPDIVGTYPILAFSQSGIRVSKETPDAANFINGVVIGDNVYIKNMGGEGISISHARDFLIKSPRIENIGYAGIEVRSGIDSVIQSPRISTVQDDGAFINHYGITITRSNTNDLVNDPKSTNIQVGQPVIKNVLNWIGFDVHAGVNITTDFVRCYNCKIPFNIQYDSTDPGVRNNCETVILNGYGESFSDETSGIGCAVLGLSDSKNENITLGLELRNCGDVGGSQTGALVIDNNNNVTGGVKLIGSKRVGMSLIGDNDEIQLNVDQRGVTWTGGSTFYVYTDAATQTNVKITGRWGFNTAGSATGADIGIFYTGAQPAKGAILFDKVRMRLSAGTNWISDGVVNKFEDFTWTLENETISLPGQLTVGGVQYDQFLGDLSAQFDRVPDVYLSKAAPEWRLDNQIAGAFDLGIRTFTNNTSPAIYKFDGTNVPAAQSIDVACNLRGVFFND